MSVRGSVLHASTTPAPSASCRCVLQVLKRAQVNLLMHAGNGSTKQHPSCVCCLPTAAVSLPLAAPFLAVGLARSAAVVAALVASVCCQKRWPSSWVLSAWRARRWSSPSGSMSRQITCRWVVGGWVGGWATV